MIACADIGTAGLMLASGSGSPNVQGAWVAPCGRPMARRDRMVTLHPRAKAAAATQRPI